jgi:hypothetical protein
MDFLEFSTSVECVCSAALAQKDQDGSGRNSVVDIVKCAEWCCGRCVEGSKMEYTADCGKDWTGKWMT